MYFENRASGLTISIWKNQDFPAHLHHNIEILLCVEGELNVTCNTTSKLLKPGDFSVAFSNDLHSYTQTDSGSGYILIFTPGISEIITKKVTENNYTNFGHCERLIELMSNLLRDFRNNEGYEITYGYLHIILGFIFKSLQQIQTENRTRPDLLTHALNYISDNYKSHITLKSVAKHCCVDQSHLSRVFSQKISGGFIHYIHQLRVEHAKKLLEDTDLSIYEIIFNSGFSNQRSFNRVFKELTGMSPKEYRKAV